MVEHHVVKLREVSLHIAEVGTGPLVILLHGFPECWFAWRHQMPALAAAGYRVVAPDMRGYNLSEKPAGVRPYGVDRLAADVAQLIEALGADRAVVAGHDWGGLVAWQVAATYPERVERLVVMNAPHPARFSRRLLVSRQFFRSSYALFFQLPWLPEWLLSLRRFALLRWALLYDPQRPDAYTVEDMRCYCAAMSEPGALAAMLNYYRASFRRPWLSRQPLTRRIELPVLVLWGEHDRFLGRELAEPDRRLVPDVRVERLPDASHWLHRDQPGRVNDLLLDFLQPRA